MYYVLCYTILCYYIHMYTHTHYIHVHMTYMRGQTPAALHTSAISIMPICYFHDYVTFSIFMYYVLCIMYYVLCIMYYVLLLLLLLLLYGLFHSFLINYKLSSQRPYYCQEFTVKIASILLT